MDGITSVFIANRGEIALRIIRACKELGIASVLAVSEADRNSLPARVADRAVCIGPPQPIESYLRVKTIVMAALGTSSDAIHPGYGFLAEQPELGELCSQHDLIFIGPKPDNIRKMGDKLLARSMAKDLGIPIIPGSELVRGPREAMHVAQQVGFPVLLKAAAGGGGKGMKTVNGPEHLETTFQEAAAEARSAFGDDRLYLEHFIPNARHIEVQILADRFGNAIHLFERDCSLQRRYQKMVEEAPSPALNDRMSEQVYNAALSIVRHIGYLNAGTVEFILDQDQDKFYFLEMNTRIQVEHPVTEMITGLDIVKEQIAIAAGKPLSVTQKEVRRNGHAIECRINAELPEADFRPCPGQITRWNPPSMKQVRVDSHCYTGYFVPPYYDSLLAKLITKGDDRPQAIGLMVDALANFTVSGVDTTIPLYDSIMKNPEYRDGKINTRWVEHFLQRELNKDEPSA
jgi:acetyl-CoA carboxylase biotin carboxylase subunit